MTDNLDGRMLLSHNFTLTEGEVHPLNREEFAEVFSKGLNETAGINATLIENPHWVVDVAYATSQYSPAEAGKLCIDALAAYRADHKKAGFTIMALGGKKTTPATGAPPSLQTGEWGVDVVETAAPDEFLEEINWDKLSGTKPADDIFRIDHAI